MANYLKRLKEMTEKAKETAKATDKKRSKKSDKKDEKLKELELQVDESKDKYLRLYAEFENYKKRTIKEKMDLLKTAAQETLKDLLPILDDFDRAKQSAEDDDSVEQFSDGVTLVYNKLNSTLANKGLEAMVSTGEVFDPELHEAITEIPAPTEEQKGTVIDTVSKGYILNDKIIRHAKVVVGK